ncbi:hypothetical protein [Prolixibacter sp. NT017]|uniref:hypothetical protein n=1 Tax=Prolixibacter sp. NT017 TaxID=2652390 RepID=UPI0012991F32|nr:hypothetical protein [Prolixibacter sp. NT017]
MTRVKVFDAFSFINNTDFWIGNPNNYIPVMEKLGAAGVENSYIVIIMNYGLIMSVILFFYLFSWIKNQVQYQTLYNKAIIIVSFILVGSLNNGLAGPNAWVFFILCSHSFPFVFQPTFKLFNISKSNLNKPYTSIDAARSNFNYFS